VVAAVGANAAAVAEQALALLLACAKSVPQLNERMHAGHWDKATHKSVELGGRTIGLVGLGAIGLRFAKMADAWACACSASTRSPRTCRTSCRPPTWKPSGASDAISLHCPLTDDNRDLLDADTLARCKRA
jgi:D-3-phosphoglycerate dehydrogenase